MPDIFPSSDAQFTHWLERYVETLAGPGVSSPLSEAQKAVLVEALLQWKCDYGAALLAEAQAARALEARLRSAAAVEACMSMSQVRGPEGSLVLLEVSTESRPGVSRNTRGGPSAVERTLGAA